jgi:hypothetical protein
MKITPLSLKDANRFIANFHRHSKKVTGAKFAIGLEEDSELIGVAIAGRPVARLLDNGKTIEILRVCVKVGFKNANSKLYAHIKRICQLMGYGKIITYTLKYESGSSLKAIGARQAGDVKAGAWSRLNRYRKNQKIYSEEKIRWEL